ncbi:hypothetical protein BZG36_02976 [Bifiguratus adelaidae]|uniref:Presequence translocated-associated motor subunit PAM17 n=1 Tax=Bifiguratus adelaidae TaxID=1938954 RepID=A0A261Y128_9FUNG|nr:hypothetical protein BZG36_02976 [Bifiguratus adelaidae]
MSFPNEEAAFLGHPNVYVITFGMNKVESQSERALIHTMLTIQRVLVRAQHVPVRCFATSASRSTDAQEHLKTWDDYFKLRSKRRTYDRLFQIPSGVAGLLGGGAYVSQLEVDPTQLVFGQDPLLMYALGILGCGFGGFLVGPVIGGTMFKLLNRDKVRQLEERDKAFYEHLVRNRADARLNSIRNPVPDYYGEKINSVRDYRAWLRKQREHTRKGTFGGAFEE